MDHILPQESAARIHHGIPNRLGKMTTIFGGVWAFVIPKLRKESIPRRIMYIFSAEKKHFKS